eukprot:CAMPEP_0201229946 /NCGR_PEP_ID=MMETSP0852-20130820/1330_1 /ASSEMBLY_ACC=CAM_ASM_000632 /TAXON_ID=183588 /ORGANISM="Pseudo-nitzschia fraudulenta, Strain WWA7" /LENGTH=74 /DNA_ID=CAMNT_0047520437 /DNA_START=65 /DNA_END=285 /DNA_ORIENTATION=-
MVKLGLSLLLLLVAGNSGVAAFSTTRQHGGSALRLHAESPSQTEAAVASSTGERASSSNSNSNSNDEARPRPPT